MKKTLPKIKKIAMSFSFMMINTMAFSQTYYWTGNTNSDFHTTTNWYSTSAVDFTASTKDAAIISSGSSSNGNSPIVNTDLTATWYPLIFNHNDGTIVINKPFLTHYNDITNGIMEINSGGVFQALQIVRVGGNNMPGVVNVNDGGALKALDITHANWQGIFIGASQNGTGTVNVNNGGLVDGGYNLEVGCRDYYPTGTLNIATGGTAQSYWATWIGPNGVINVNGGNLNCGQTLSVGELFLDNASNVGTQGAKVGQLNINSGIVTVNQNDLPSPTLLMNTKAKIVIDNGTLRIKSTGVNQSSSIYSFIVSGQISAVTGKTINLSYDGVYTTITAGNLSTAENTKKAIKIYPNPIKDLLTINENESLEIGDQINILSLEGKVIYQSKITSKKDIRINLSTLPRGTYILNIQSKEGLKNTKFIKE